MFVPITNVCVMIFLTGIASHVNAQTIDCDNYNNLNLTCAYDIFNCDMVNNVDCIIQCLTSSSCEEAIFNGGAGNMEINCGAYACNYATFNGGDGTMVINCNDQSACSGTTWNGGNGDLIASCTGAYSCEEGYKNCPAAKYCNITCDGTNACSVGRISSGDGNTIINVIASGDEALGEVNLYCPQNSISGGSPNSCNIYGYNTPNKFMMSNLKIYAVEGYHDVNIICDNGNQGCWENYQSSTRATLYCTPGWTENCELSWDSNDVNVKCFQPPSTAPTVHICEDYLLPTPTPTVGPINPTTTTAPTSTTTAPTTTEPTISPTFNPTPSPTFYHPNNGRRQILYVSELGCDYGYCMNENYTNYDNEIDNFDYCDYNSVCCDIPSAISSCQDTIDSWEASKGPYGWYIGDKIIAINNPGIWSGSVIGDDGSEDDTRDLIRIVCFEIEAPFICVNPIVKVEFEDISYAYTVAYHFNVSYQNESEVAGCSGGSGTKTCGSWYECPVDMQPIDGPWIADGGGHAFWIRDSQPAGQVWRPECFNPRRTFNVRVSVNCSTIDVNPPRCRTLDYTWSCFNGIDGAPVDTVCSDVGYDGNGEIKISRGTYTLNDNIYVQTPYQQVVIEGRGKNNTFLNQIIYNDNIAISCQMCNLTMKGFTYHIESSGIALLASNIIIEIFNGGNTTFDDIVFMSDVQRLKFIFSNYSNVEFTNCIFQKNVTFNVTNGATVSFRNCTFMNISANLATTEIPYNDATTTEGVGITTTDAGTTTTDTTTTSVDVTTTSVETTDDDACVRWGANGLEKINGVCEWCFKNQGRQQLCESFSHQIVTDGTGSTSQTAQSFDGTGSTPQTAQSFDFSEWVAEQVDCFIAFCPNLDCDKELIKLKEGVILEQNCGCDAFECVPCQSECDANTPCVEAFCQENNEAECNKCVECLEDTNCAGETCQNNVCGGNGNGGDATQISVIVAILLVTSVFGWM